MRTPGYGFSLFQFLQLYIGGMAAASTPQEKETVVCCVQAHFAGGAHTEASGCASPRKETPQGADEANNDSINILLS